MRFGIVSDIHLGDDMCSLMTFANGKYVPGEKYEEFKSKLGQDNDYLIVAGDIIDLSIRDYPTAFTVAKAFFKQIQTDKLAKNIIYVVGNHDFDLWHTVEYQINIIYRIREGGAATGFKWSVPGLIDDRGGSPVRGFQLPGTTGVIDPDKFAGEPLFINAITTDGPGTGTPTNFYFAYPNLYIVTDTESIIVTHGHYLEAYWTMTCEWVQKIAKEDLEIGDALDLREMVAINFPTCQLACSGVGQAGPLTFLVQKIQREVKDRDLARVNRYIDRVDDEIDKHIGGGLLSEPATDLIMNEAKKKLKEKLAEFKDTRYSREFIYKEEVRERFRRFYDSSWIEICELNADGTLNIPAIPSPSKVIFGHTHQPIAWNDPNAPKNKTLSGIPVRLFNTGGWLFRQPKGGQREFCGAEIFTYDSSTGFSSQRVG